MRKQKIYHRIDGVSKTTYNLHEDLLLANFKSLEFRPIKKILL